MAQIYVLLAPTEDDLKTMASRDGLRMLPDTTYPYDGLLTKFLNLAVQPDSELEASNAGVIALAVLIDPAAAAQSVRLAKVARAPANPRKVRKKDG